MPTKADDSGLPIKVLHIIDWALTVIELREGVPPEQIRARLRGRGYYSSRIARWMELASQDTGYTKWTRVSLEEYRTTELRKLGKT